LEDLDSLLTSGNIPDLFDNDELDAIFMEIKQDAYIDGVHIDDKTELYKYLINVYYFFYLFLNKSKLFIIFINQIINSEYKRIFIWYCR
jgi:hypothetical protein